MIDIPSRQGLPGVQNCCRYPQELSHLIYFSLLALLTCSFYSLKAINSLKHVDSTALLQFLYPILNMLLHLIGNGGETLQVFQLKSSSSLA